ncbi:MAG: hypothetical protein Q4G46_07850, partial [Propionibacteriaceae bacterium]|nr:hypothetical protein [Propionibacteriaceae bacterium]
MVGLPLAAALLAACGSAGDPSDKRIRERAAHADVGLDARLTPLMRQHQVQADWKADYCVDDPLTTHEWNCYATRNIAITAPELRTTAQAVDTELTRLGCHPQGEPNVMGLAVMLEHHGDTGPAHELPAVEFRCGEDTIFVQPSDRSDDRLSTLQRPTAWPAAAVGKSSSRMMGGGTIDPGQAQRLASAAEPFFL